MRADGLGQGSEGRRRHGHVVDELGVPPMLVLGLVQRRRAGFPGCARRIPHRRRESGERTSSHGPSEGFGPNSSRLS